MWPHQEEEQVRKQSAAPIHLQGSDVRLGFKEGKKQAQSSNPAKEDILPLLTHHVSAPDSPERCSFQTVWYLFPGDKLPL